MCGFILPRLFIKQYGSEINGLVSSITQFLSIISFLELGVGAIIQSALYKPLASNDKEALCAIYSAGNKFFRKIAFILAAYVAVLTVVYPFLAGENYGWLYTAMLILAIGISSFAQYYFGIVDRILLVADQRGYIVYNSQILTLVANTVACVLLIRAGASIHVVKLTTSVIYLLRPLLIRLYVNSHYKFSLQSRIAEDPLKQKWDAITQHISYIILNDTDTVVLTLFSTMTNVSIYSIYYMVVNGIKTLFMSATNGFQSIMGEFWAKQEKEKLSMFFSLLEYVMHTAIVLVFTVTAILIVPFVSVYTSDIADADYRKPLFAVLLVAAHACHCLRTPYHIMIKAAGHYKQTSVCYLIAAALNIIISVISVYYWGLVGVALGTLIAMLYQTIWMAVYNSKNLIKISLRSFFCQCAVDILCVILCIASTCWIKLSDTTFVAWVFMALKVCAVSTIVVFLVNAVIFPTKTRKALQFLKRK